MKKPFTTVLLLGTSLFLAFPLPAFATPDAESCLNKLLDRKMPWLSGANAELMLSIEDHGKDYHWLKLSKGSGIYSNVEAVISTDSKGRCSLTMLNITGPLATKEAYEEILGPSVSEKFYQAFQQARHQ